MNRSRSCLSLDGRLRVSCKLPPMRNYPYFCALPVADRLRIVAEEARYRGVPARLARLLDYLADLLERP